MSLVALCSTELERNRLYSLPVKTADSPALLLWVILREKKFVND